MHSDDPILDLIDSIYAAAANPGRWTEVLERLARALSGHIATLHHQNLASTESSFAADWNMDPEAVAEYTAYFAPLNVWFTTRPELLTEGQVFTNTMLCPDDLLIRTEFYNDWLRPHNIGDGIAAMVFKSGSATSTLSVFRQIKQPGFSEADLRLLRVLVPHLRRAVQLHTRIQALESKADAAADALDQLQQGVVLLNAKGNTLLVNRAGRAILGNGGFLKLTRCGLVAAVPSENRRLRALIHGAINTGCHLGLDSGGAMQISRNGNRSPLQILVMPLRTDTVYVGKDVPAAAVFISDPDREPISEAQIFAELFGLTPAEARLARILAAGDTLKEASEQLDVSKSTVKSQLKSIFAKTETSRQSQLVRLILLTPPHIRQARVVD